MQEPDEYKRLDVNNDDDRELIEEILSTRRPIIRSEQFKDPDQLEDWVADTLSLNFDVVNERLWEDMEAKLPRIREKYNSYRASSNDPMSFYVAKQGGVRDEKLFVLLWIEWEGDDQEPPAVLWTFE